MKKTVLLLIFILTGSLFSQTSEELGEKALEELDAKNFNEAVKLLDSAFVLSGNYVYQYEKALVFYKRKKFEQTAKIIESFIYHDDIEKNELYYQLLASAYDFIGNKEKAFDVLYTGILEFPDSAPLYYELGVTEFGRQNISEAVKYWDRGISNDPNYPGNYFQLMKESNENNRKVYSMIFAEIFLNLPASDEKKVEASTLLYKIYKTSLIKSPGTSEPSFTEYVGNYDAQKAAEYPFRTAYQQIANKVYKPKLLVTLADMVDFRENFIKEWHVTSYNELFPNPIFDYQKLLLDNGLLEVHSYLMLSSGDKTFSTKWLSENRDLIIKYIDWQKSNPLDLTKNIFNTSVYLSN